MKANVQATPRNREIMDARLEIQAGWTPFERRSRERLANTKQTELFAALARAALSRRLREWIQHSRLPTGLVAGLMPPIPQTIPVENVDAPHGKQLVA